MELDDYHAKAAEEYGTFHNMLADIGPEILYDACKKYGKEPTVALLSEHENDFPRYIRSQHRDRTRLVNKLPTEDRLLFLVCVSYHMRRSLALLGMMCDHGVAPGLPHKFVISQAATLMNELDELDVAVWPFEDHSCPFDDEI